VKKGAASKGTTPYSQHSTRHCKRPVEGRHSKQAYSLQGGQLLPYGSKVHTLLIMRFQGGFEREP
jgi:hypothetical protein